MREMLRLVLVLGVICTVSALSLAVMNDLTREPIAEQKRAEFTRSLARVLPGAEFDVERGWVELPGPDGAPLRVYLGQREGAPAGVAFELAAPGGYSGTIRLMLGVSPDGKLGGIAILEHRETPGLGDKVAKEPWLAQFPGRSLDDTRFKVRKDGGDIDQISGATISPRAVTEAVRKGLEWFRANQGSIGAGAAA